MNSNTTRTATIQKNGLSLTTVVALILMVLKLTGVIHLSWWIIVGIFCVPMVLALLVLVVIATGLGVLAVTDTKNTKSKNHRR